MSDYVVKLVRPARDPLYLREDGCDPDPCNAARFDSYRDAAARLSTSRLPDGLEFHIVPAPPQHSWTVEEILAREG